MASDRSLRPARVALALLQGVLCHFFLPNACAFTARPAVVTGGRSLANGTKLDHSGALADVEAVKSSIMAAIQPTKRGLSATPDQRVQIESKISALETICPVMEPARDPRMAGHWFVRYTTAPPPSNGQLGPFVGVAEQEIGLNNGKYRNILNVGPNDWLAATLDADWEEWDGRLLEEKDEEGRKKWVEGMVKAETLEDTTEAESSAQALGLEDTDGSTRSDETPRTGLLDSIQNLMRGTVDKQTRGRALKKQDYGATSWRVTFDSLTIRLFGLPLVTKKFQDTSRVWKMTYIDDDTRVVRAGRTGKSEDDVVFYMTRQFDKN